MDEIGHQPGVLSAGVVSNVPLSGNSGKSAATVKGHVTRPGESPRGHYSYGLAVTTSAPWASLCGRDDSSRTPIHGARSESVWWTRTSRGTTGRMPALLANVCSKAPRRETDAEAFTIVGVVGSVKQAGLTDDAAQGAIYYPYVFRNDSDIFVVARTGIPPESLGLALQKVVRQIDPDLPVNDLRSMETRIADSLVARRSPALLAGLFAGIALLLTSIGTYGVLSYAVAQRRREIGVRMALGARPEQIRGQFLSLALRLLAFGTVLGIVGAWLAGRAMQTVLFHVPALNLAILASAAGVMGVVSLLACLLPAHRAARISPMEALGEE